MRIMLQNTPEFPTCSNLWFLRILSVATMIMYVRYRSYMQFFKRSFLYLFHILKLIKFDIWYLIFLIANCQSLKIHFSLSTSQISRILFVKRPSIEETQLIWKEKKTIYEGILDENNDKMMLAAYIPRFGQTQTQDILRTNCESWFNKVT